MRAKIIIAASMAFTLAGCGAMGTNTSLYSTNQPVVERANYALDLSSDSSGGIPAFEQSRLREWFEAMKLRFGDRVTIDYGYAYGNGVAKQAVANLASQYGVLISETAPVTAGNVAAGTVRVVVSRSSASVPNCPNWSKTTEGNYNSSNHPNYGCATNSNLAAMVADPEDLVRGRQAPSARGSGAFRTLPGDGLAGANAAADAAAADAAAAGAAAGAAGNQANGGGNN
jgi:pilus assembly protein CpaD